MTLPFFAQTAISCILILFTETKSRIQHFVFQIFVQQASFCIFSLNNTCSVFW